LAQKYTLPLSEAKFYKTMTTRYSFNLTNNDSFRESSVSIRISER